MPCPHSQDLCHAPSGSSPPLQQKNPPSTYSGSWKVKGNSCLPACRTVTSPLSVGKTDLRLLSLSCRTSSLGKSVAERYSTQQKNSTTAQEYFCQSLTAAALPQLGHESRACPVGAGHCPLSTCLQARTTQGHVLGELGSFPRWAHFIPQPPCTVVSE